MGLVTLLTLIAHQTPIFAVIKKELGNKSWIFSTSLPLHLRKARPLQRKTLTVDQRLYRVQTEETNYKNVFLQPHDVPSKNELSLSYTVAVVTILWPFRRCCRNTRLLS